MATFCVTNTHLTSLILIGNRILLINKLLFICLKNAACQFELNSKPAYCVMFEKGINNYGSCCNVFAKQLFYCNSNASSVGACEIHLFRCF